MDSAVDLTTKINKPLLVSRAFWILGWGEGDACARCRALRSRIPCSISGKQASQPDPSTAELRLRDLVASAGPPGGISKPSSDGLCASSSHTPSPVPSFPASPPSTSPSELEGCRQGQQHPALAICGWPGSSLGTQPLSTAFPSLLPPQVLP